MFYSEYGKTGAMVSAIGFGGMQFDVSKSNEENAELLCYAYDKGINYFDTAPGYCDDRSEDIFGIAMKLMADKRDQFYVSTKGMPTDVDSPEKAVEMVKKSLKRLNLEKIDFYHVWCLRKMEHYEMAVRQGGQYEGLLRCKEEGLIDNIVVSSHLPGSQITDIMKNGEFAGVLLGVNILNFLYRWEGVQQAYSDGYGVVAMNPLAGGQIPKNEKEFAFLAGEGETPTETAIRFIVSCPEITIALMGFTTREHIDMACRIAEEAKPFTMEDMNRIQHSLSTNMNSLCTGCGYCRKSCPKNIHVPGYMQFYNAKPLFGKTDKQMIEQLKFDLEWGLLVEDTGRSADCIECGKCEETCTQHLDIIRRLAEIADMEKAVK